MLMVIMGAGASYDSAPDRPAKRGDDHKHRPPLADDLFLDDGLRHNARQQFPQIHELIPELLPRPGRSLEDSLQRLQDESAIDPYRLEQLAAVRYYLQTLFRALIPQWLNDIGSVTNYLSLLGQIFHHWRAGDPPVCLVTFNYDTLIEHALEQRFRFKFEFIPDFVSHREFKLFKLHGSENWGRHLTKVPSSISARNNPWAQPEEMIRQVAHLGISNVYSIAGGNIPHSGPPLFPAIAIPVLNKSTSTFECPPEHLGELANLIPHVTKILTIGWRGKEQHFLSMLAKGLGSSATGIDIVTVAGTEDEAKQTLAQIRGAGIPVRVGSLSVEGCFASFSDSLADRRFDPLFSV